VAGDEVVLAGGGAVAAGNSSAQSLLFSSSNMLLTFAADLRHVYLELGAIALSTTAITASGSSSATSAVTTGDGSVATTSSSASIVSTAQAPSSNNDNSSLLIAVVGAGAAGGALLLALAVAACFLVMRRRRKQQKRRRLALPSENPATAAPKPARMNWMNAAYNPALQETTEPTVELNYESVESDDNALYKELPAEYAAPMGDPVYMNIQGGGGATARRQHGAERDRRWSSEQYAIDDERTRTRAWNKTT
jgi:hypothetical protein